MVEPTQNINYTTHYSKLVPPLHDEINEEATKQLLLEKKYVQYLKFLKDNGAKISKKLNFPVAFERLAYIGIGAAEDIEAQELLLAIPNCLVLSSQRAHSHPDIGFVLSENKHIFGEGARLWEERAGNFNSLVFLVMYERARSEDSFYAPIFDVTSSSDSLLEWSEEEVACLGSPYLTSKFQHFRARYIEVRQLFHELVLKYSPVLPKSDLVTGFKTKFDWAFKFCMTRRMNLTSSLETTFCVPLIDFVNHGAHGRCCFGIIHSQYEQRKYENQAISLGYTQFYSKSVSFERLFGQNFQEQCHTVQQEQEDAEQILRNYLQINHLLFTEENNREVTSNTTSVQRLSELVAAANYRKLLADEDERQVWNLPLLALDEDADDSELRDEFQLEQEAQKLRRRAQVEAEEQQLVEETQKFWKLDQQQDQKEDKSESQSDSLSQLQLQQASVDDSYLKSYYDEREEDDDDDEEEEEEEEKKKKKKEQDHKQSLKKTSENEKKGPETVTNVSAQSQPLNKGACTNARNSWYRENDEQVYGILYSVQAVRKNTQLQLLYNRSGNDDYLIYHGFSVADNPYERIRFRFVMSAQNEEDFAQNLSQYILQQFLDKENHQKELQSLTREYTLKKSQFSKEVLGYLRAYISSLKDNTPIVLYPQSFGKELVYLHLYERVIAILDLYSATQYLSEKIIKASPESQGIRQSTATEHFVNIYRSERRAIFESQREAVADLQEILTLLCNQESRAEDINLRAVYVQVLESKYRNLDEVERFARYKRITPYLKELFEYVVLKRNGVGWE